MNVSVRVDLNGLEQALHDLGPKIAKATMRKSLTAVGLMWVDAINNKVPLDTGALLHSIYYKIRTKPTDEAGSVTVGPTYTDKGSQDPGVYGMFQEFGTKKMAAHPFMRPTFDSTAENAIELFATTMRNNLEGVKGESTTSHYEKLRESSEGAE